MSISPLARTVALVGCLLCLTCMAALIGQADVRLATTHTVTNTADTGPGSLRDALASANDGDTITFDVATPATITLTSGELVVEDALTIEGPGPELLAISGGGVSRVISAGSSITLTGLTLRDGYHEWHGGGLYCAGDLCIAECTIRECASDYMGGGAYVVGRGHVVSSTLQGNQTRLKGGGLRIEGTVNLTRTEVLSNTTAGEWLADGGGVCCRDILYASECTISGNQGNRGGGVYANWHAHITRSLMSHNHATLHGGAIWSYLSLSITDSQLLSNTSDMGGGAMAADCEFTMANCLVQGNQSDGSGGAGGGYHTVVTNSQFIRNSSAEHGGALYAGVDTRIQGCTFIENSAGSYGGAIRDDGPMHLDDCVFLGNEAAGRGGVVASWNEVVVSDCQMRDNTAFEEGGCLWLRGSLRVVGSELLSNASNGNGGAISHQGSLTLDSTDVLSNVSGADGGGVYCEGAVSVETCQISANAADQNGGAVYVREGPLLLARSQILSNTCGALGGGAYVWGDAQVSGSRFEGNTAGGAWGALGIQSPDRLDVIDSQFVENHAGSVGGIMIGEGTLNHVLLQGNVADTNVGAISAGGPVTISNSSIVSNTSSRMGMIVNTYDLALVNTTVAGNTSTGEGPGALHLVGPATLASCTIANNTSESGPGAIFKPLAGPTLLTNTIVAGNTSSTGSPDLSGEFVSGGNNLIGNSDGATGFADGVNGDMVGTKAAPLDPLLGALGDYGGDTPTMPLLPGSPAIDAAGPAAPEFDQRGFPRVCLPDIGAFEAQGFALAMESGDGQTAPEGHDFTEPLSVRVIGIKGGPVDGGVVTFSAPSAGASASLSATSVRIVDGLVSVNATANDITGTYQVQARARGARPVTIYRPSGHAQAEPTVPPTVVAPVEEPLAFTLTNAGGSMAEHALSLPMVLK